MIDVGKRATWPRLHMVSNRMKIEAQIDAGRDQVKRAMRLTGIVHRYSPFVDADTSTVESNSDFDFSDTARKAAINIAKFDCELDQSGGESSAPSPAKNRRKEIIRRLGLNRSNRRQTSDSSGNRKASGGSNSRSFGEGENNLRRPLSVGQLQLAQRVTRPGAESSEDDGDFEEADYSSGERF